MRLVLMTAARQATTEVLPALGLLAHQVRVVAPELSSLLDGDSGDVVLVDARHDLIQARTLCGLLSSTGVAAALVAVLSEGGLVALSADWGVDDVLLDTAGPAEVDARLKWATARRLAATTPADGADGGVTQAGELVIDEHSYSAKLRGRPLDLTYKEFELLKYLAQHPGRVFSRAQLLQEIWGYDYFGGTRTVDVHVRRLRAKLGTEHEALIGTVRNVGYKLDQQVADATAKAAARRPPPRTGPTPSWSDDRVSRPRLPTSPTSSRCCAPPRPPTACARSPRRPSCGCSTAARPAAATLVVRDGDPRRVRPLRGRTTAASRPSWSCTPPSGGAGIGRALLDRLVELAGARPLSVWAHGDLPGSAELLAPRGFARARVLLQMRRDLAGVDPDPRPALPDGVHGAAVPAGPRTRPPGCGSTPAPSPRTPSRAAGPPRTSRLREAGALVRRRRASCSPGAGTPTPAASCSAPLDEGAPARGRRPTRRSARSTCWASTPTRRACASGRALTDLGLAHLRGRGLARGAAVRRGGQRRRRRGCTRAAVSAGSPSTSPGGATPR